MPQDTITTTPTPPDDLMGLNACHARLLGQLAARLHRQAQGRHHNPTSTSSTARRQVVVDLDHDTDTIDVYLALLQGGAALTQNQQLRGYLANLTSQHALAALTAAHLWTLLDQAATTLGRHRGLDDRERELACALEQMGELGELPIAKVPAVGVELHEELEAARQLIAALDTLQEATASGDHHQVRSCQQLLDCAREEYRELVAGHVHAPIGP